MEDIPSYVPGTFLAIALAVLGFIFYAVHTANPYKNNITPAIVITLLISWIFVISLLTFNGYFNHLSGIPRMPAWVIGLLTVMMACFVFPKSRAFLFRLPITTLHYIHITRVPVEMVLWWLAVSRAIPMDMTFEGSNMDILSGISAPFAAVFMVGKKNKSRIGAILWNIIAMGLLIYVVSLAVGYSPYLYTPSGGEIGNLGVFYFPYVLLPTFIVPVILMSHLVSLMQLIFKKDQSQY